MDCAIDLRAASEPRLLLLANVENAAELRSILLSTSGEARRLEGIALVKAALLPPDLMQVRVAARKAQAASRAGKMTTRTVSAELVYNLSSTKNIRESLEKFGVGDGDKYVRRCFIL